MRIKVRPFQEMESLERPRHRPGTRWLKPIFVVCAGDANFGNGLVHDGVNRPMDRRSRYQRDVPRETDSSEGTGVVRLVAGPTNHILIYAVLY